MAGRHLTQLGFAAHDGPGRPGACQADGFSRQLFHQTIGSHLSLARPRGYARFWSDLPLQEILIQHQWLGLQRT